MAKLFDLDKWMIEVEMAEKFKEEEFGKFDQDNKELAGKNIDYYENGYSLNNTSVLREWTTTLNIVDALASIIVPSLYFKNPKSVVKPMRIESEDSAPIVARIIDHYLRLLKAEIVNKKVIFDAYLLGFGVCKLGYATKYGMDVEDKDVKKKPSVVDKALQVLGLKKEKKPEDTVTHPEDSLRIISENPFIEYVNPFDFGIDPRATSIEDARYIYQKFNKNVSDIKRNPQYKNTQDMKGDSPEIKTLNMTKVSEAAMEELESRILYEIHYRNKDKFYRLVYSKYSGGDYRAHYHEESIYELDEWQYEVLSFKNHGHALYPKSDVSKLRNLQDRVTNTIDAILEQVDKFIPKIAIDSTGVTPGGKVALQSGIIGAIVECTKNPNEVIKDINFVQLKADLQALLDQLITLITIQTGITRAQLTGVSQSDTATEAQIQQGGSNLRMSDMVGSVQSYLNNQSRKLFKIVAQFVDLEELNLINGSRGIDPMTGVMKYDWLIVDPVMREKIINGQYDFDIEVGSTQKIDLAVIRKAFENMFNIIARPDVILMLQQQGKKVEVAEALRKYFDLFPEMGIDSGKIIQNIGPQTQGLIPPEQDARGGQTIGSSNNQMASQMAEATPTMGRELNSVY